MLPLLVNLIYRNYSFSVTSDIILHETVSNAKFKLQNNQNSISLW